MSLLFDSNILIYHLNGQLTPQSSQLITQGLSGDGNYSIISKIELLGFHQTPAQEQAARLLLSGLNEIQLTTAIAEQTIQLRKAHKIKLPDAIIAGTALVQQLTLVTRNVRDFSVIAGLSYLNPFV